MTGTSKSAIAQQERRRAAQEAALNKAPAPAVEREVEQENHTGADAEEVEQVGEFVTSDDPSFDPDADLGADDELLDEEPAEIAPETNDAPEPNDAPNSGPSPVIDASTPVDLAGLLQNFAESYAHAKDHAATHDGARLRLLQQGAPYLTFFVAGHEQNEPILTALSDILVFLNAGLDAIQQALAPAGLKLQVFASANNVVTLKAVDYQGVERIRMDVGKL